jgi:uncharacterized membrane protein
MDLTAFGSNDLNTIASRAGASDGSPAGLGEGTVTVTPTTPVVPSRGLRIQGMPWRSWLRTTPGRLRGASAILLLALLLFAVVTTVATEVRSRAAGSVQTTSAPELVAIEKLYGSLADADATASTIFLRAGAEPPGLRSRYLDDIHEAGLLLATVARGADSSTEARGALRTIGESLPRYAGLVDTARANTRLGIQVGSAYLHTASLLMREQMLPAATTLYRQTARNLDRNYRSGTSVSTFAVVVIVGIAMLGLLVLVQVYVRRRSNRLLNVGLVGASVLVIVILGWTLLRFSAAHEALNRAQSHGSDSVEVLSSARILALLAQNNENLALVERGSGDVYVAEFARLMRDLGGRDGHGGLLREAALVADRTGEGDRIRQLATPFSALMRLHSDVRTYDDQGDYNEAVGLSVGTTDEDARTQLASKGGTHQELDAVDHLQRELQTDITRAQARLLGAAADARQGYGVLEVAIPVLAILAGLLVLLGLERRIAEFR